MTNLPELTRRMAAIKAISDIIKAEETATKTALLGHLDPGDRKMAVADDGTNLATISRAKITETSQIAIKDEDALIAWLEREHDGDGVYTIKAVHEWKITDILRAAEETGDLPPGVDFISTTRGGYVSVRQSAEQAAAVLTTPDLLTTIIAAKEIDQ